jgi:hypothetical protein
LSAVRAVKAWLQFTLAAVGILLVVVAIVAAILLGSVAMIFHSWIPTLRPSDAVMIEKFQQKREIFETLVKMIREDRGLKRVDVDWTDPADPSTIGVGPERIALYRQLCREAGVSRGFYQFDTVLVFVGYAAGMVVHGSSKNYVHGRGKYDPEEIDGDLDAAAGKERKFYGWRRIDENWSLELTIN